MGSLYTSIIPSLIVPGVGACICSLPSSCRRVLMLNGIPDRETGGMNAVAYVVAIVRAICQSFNDDYGEREGDGEDDNVNNRTVTGIDSESETLDRNLINSLLKLRHHVNRNQQISASSSSSTSTATTTTEGLDGSVSVDELGMCLKCVVTDIFYVRGSSFMDAASASVLESTLGLRLHCVPTFDGGNGGGDCKFSTVDLIEELRCVCEEMGREINR